MSIQSDNSPVRVGVVGGGAAGMMAAYSAKAAGAQVTLFEHMAYLGRKLGITGKGRCNVTNATPMPAFLENVPQNPRFLYAALRSFGTDDTCAFFEERGVPLKTERGARVFPVSDKARDIVDALRDSLDGVNKVFEKVASVSRTDDGFCVNGKYRFDKIILATGGRSYPQTGSDGSGFRLARKLGHTVTQLVPSLVPIESSSDLPARMQGLSLKNVAIKLCRDGKEIYSDFGEMLFTHFGVSGPMILSASAHLKADEVKGTVLSIDLKPALDEKTLDARLLSDFAERSNKEFSHALDALLPAKMIPVFIEVSGIDPHKRINLITKEERKKLLHLFRSFEIPLSRFRPIEEAIVTRGGIDVKEINPKTMESKLCPGLYFAGEMIDVDAYTGGFNLQIAFSTGHLAGICAAEE